MRYLAIARLRFLTSLRSAVWLFVVSILAAFFLLERTGVLFRSDRATLADFDAVTPMNGALLVGSYVLHILILVGACHAFGVVKRSAQNAGVADLLETAPIVPRHRFIGDAFGIFAAVMALHLCTLPLLALTVAVSPFSTSFFVYAELLIVALVAFDSAASSWKLRAESSRWNYTRGIRSQATFMVCFLIVLWLNTRGADFMEGFVTFMQQPSSRAFSRITWAVNDPVLFISSFVTLYASFMTFFYFHSVRSLQQR